MKFFILIFFISYFPGKVYSRVLFQPFQSSRAMGMGGTSISFVRGIDALYLNAAALARIEGYSFTLGEASVGYGKNSQRLVDQYKTTAANLAAADLTQLYNNTFFVEASAKSGMVFPYFGIGAYSSNHIHETFLDSTIPSFNVDFVSDYGYMIAGAIPLGTNVSMGITGRYLKRWAGEKNILVTSLVGTNDKDLIESLIPDKGSGNALDISFLATFPGSLSPSIAFVWKDLGGTKFQPYAGAGPNSQEDNLIFGASIQHPFAYGSWTHALEYNFIRTNGEDFSKKYHIGTEASFGVIDLRAGISQGYVTYGAGLDLSFIRADVAAYTLELGSKSGQSPSDRYQASVSINLDFDQAFKLSKDGKKRRLMQRR
jgi:hypothetical protein